MEARAKTRRRRRRGAPKSRRRRRRGGNGRGIPLPSRLRGLGERRELPQRGPGLSAPAKNVFDAIYGSQNASGGRINQCFHNVGYVNKIHRNVSQPGRKPGRKRFSQFISVGVPWCSAATAGYKLPAQF